MATTDPNTIHYTELPAAGPGSQRAVEWETYRREVGRLIVEGHEGKWVLIKQSSIVGLFDSMDAARSAGLQEFLLDGFLIHRIQVREPLIKSPKWMYFQCPDLPLSSDRAA